MEDGKISPEIVYTNIFPVTFIVPTFISYSKSIKPFRYVIHNEGYQGLCQTVKVPHNL